MSVEDYAKRLSEEVLYKFFELTSGREGPFFRASISNMASTDILNSKRGLNSAAYSGQPKRFPEKLPELIKEDSLPDGTFFDARVYKRRDKGGAYVGVLLQRHSGGFIATLETNDSLYRNFTGLDWKPYKRKSPGKPEETSDSKSDVKPADKPEDVKPEKKEREKEKKTKVVPLTREEREEKCEDYTQLGGLVREVFDEMVKGRSYYEADVTMSNGSFFRDRKPNFAGFGKLNQYLLNGSKYNMDSWPSTIPTGAEVYVKLDQPSKYLAVMLFPKGGKAVLRTNDKTIFRRNILVPWKKVEKSRPSKPRGEEK